MPDVVRGDETVPRRARGWMVLVSGLALIALWAVVLVSLGAVLELGPWLGRALTISAAAIGVACLMCASLPRRRSLAAVGGVVAGVLCWAWWFNAGGRADAWWRDPVDMVAQLWARIDRGSAPLDPSGPLEDVLLLVVLLVAAVTVLLFIGLGHPLGAGAFTAMLLLIPSGVTGFTAGGPALLIAGLLLALLAWLGSPAPSGLGLLAAGAAVAVAAGMMTVAPPTRDRVWNSALMLSPISATVPDVTVVLAEDLRRGSRASAFTYRGARPGPHRFTLATLADFEGGRWQPQSELSADRLPVTEPRGAASIPPRPLPQSDDRPMNPISITVEGLISSWLPLPQSAIRAAPIQGAPDLGQWRWAADSNTARSEQGVTRSGDTYRAESVPLLADEVLSAAVDPDAWETLGPRFSSEVSDYRAVSLLRPDGPVGENDVRLLTDPDEVPRRLAPYLALPEGVPRVISDSAQRVAGDAGNRLLVGLALQEWFRSGDFTYDEEAPYEPGTDPSDPYAVMASLLTERRGFCVHYASTFAVMARQLGVPARLAVGYAARTFRSDEETVVRGRDLHAWPEIYVDDLGWVAFEPTPGGSGFRADTNRRVPATPRERPDDAPVRTPEPSPERPSTDPTRPETPDEADPGRGGSRGAVSPAWFIAPPIVVLLLLLPAGVRRLRRGRRYRAIRQGRNPAQQAWAELIDTAHDLALLDTAGAERPRARTPEALAEHLIVSERLSGASAEAARRLGDAASAERYGGVQFDGGVIAELLAEAGSGLHDRAGRSTRIRSMLLPRSLFLRRRS